MEVLVMAVVVCGIALACFWALKPKRDVDALDRALLAQLEREAGAELSWQGVTELNVELSKITDVTVRAAQLRGLKESEMLRLYRKGSIQAHMTALHIARDPRFASLGLAKT